MKRATKFCFKSEKIARILSADCLADWRIKRFLEALKAEEGKHMQFCYFWFWEKNRGGKFALSLFWFSIITCWKFSSSKFHSLGIDHVKLSEKHLSLWKKKEKKKHLSLWKKKKKENNKLKFMKGTSQESACFNLSLSIWQHVNMSMSMSAHLFQSGYKMSGQPQNWWLQCKTWDVDKPFD